eukprot:Hpha_TRINITY_DN32128_c0_g1::TRINITY_DN32128_c0_g1_i1::g.18399::m.18399
MARGRRRDGSGSDPPRRQAWGTRGVVDPTPGRRRGDSSRSPSAERVKPKRRRWGEGAAGGDSSSAEPPARAARDPPRRRRHDRGDSKSSEGAPRPRKGRKAKRRGGSVGAAKPARRGGDSRERSRSRTASPVGTPVAPGRADSEGSSGRRSPTAELTERLRAIGLRLTAGQLRKLKIAAAEADGVKSADEAIRRLAKLSESELRRIVAAVAPQAAERRRGGSPKKRKRKREDGAGRKEKGRDSERKSAPPAAPEDMASLSKRLPDLGITLSARQVRFLAQAVTHCGCTANSIDDDTLVALAKMMAERVSARSESRSGDHKSSEG